MSNLDNNGSLTSESNLHLAEVDLKEWGKRKFWYVGVEKELTDLLTETFFMQTYKDALTKKDMVILDIGAYIGDTALAFHNYAKKIYAVEPNPDAYECMLRNVKQFNLDRVIPIKKALWSDNGRQRIYSSGGTNTGATLTPFSVFRKGWDVEATTIDKLFDDYGLDRVDLLKLDVEGSEYAILESEGFEKVADKIDKIVLEAHPFFISGVTGATIWKIPYLLQKHGFVCRVINSDMNWSIKVTYHDGRVEWVPMRIFLAEREAK